MRKEALQDDDFEKDLRIDPHAGQNTGSPSYETHPAFDIKELHDRLYGYRDDELKAIPVIVEGGAWSKGRSIST